MTARDALTAVVKSGAKNLGRDDIGEISPGFAADFVGFRTDSIAFAGAQRDVVCALIFCSPGADQVCTHLSALNIPRLSGIGFGVESITGRFPHDS